MQYPRIGLQNGLILNMDLLVIKFITTHDGPNSTFHTVRPVYNDHAWCTQNDRYVQVVIEYRVVHEANFSHDKNAMFH